MPMPTAAPCTAAISGFEKPSIASMKMRNPCSLGSAAVRSSLADGSICAISFRSWPAENPFPAPVRITTRTESSASAASSADPAARYRARC